MLLLDLETRSHADLPKVGADQYAIHPTTQVLVMSFKLIGGDTTYSWMPLHPDLSPHTPTKTARALWGRLTRRDTMIVAHNSDFDRAVYNAVLVQEYGFPEIPIERWMDSATLARINGLPSSLEDACAVTDAAHKKYARGKMLIRELSIPPFNEDTKLLDEMRVYCEADIASLENLMEVMRPMMGPEHEDWLITHEINARGIPLDVELATEAVKYATAEKEAIGGRLSRLTAGEVSAPTQVKRTKDWIERLIDPAVFAACTDHGRTLDKGARADLLAEPDLAPAVREVIECIDAGNLASVGKYQRMVDMVDPHDNRVRGAIVHAGAGRTQRFSSRGMQIHNFRRDVFGAHEAEGARDCIIAHDSLVEPMTTLARMLRSAIVASPGHVLIVGDWSAIEARVLPWLSADLRTADVMKTFRRGDDVYQLTADKMGLDVLMPGVEDTRQIGKVATLALGFGGSVGAFQSMAANYGVKVTDDEARAIVEAWRMSNPWAPAFWQTIETAMSEAYSNPMVEVEAGRLKYTYVPEHLGGTMWCELPDGTLLHYPFFEPVFTSRGVSYSTIKASRRPRVGEPWPQDRLWGGLTAENGTQATAAAILRDTLRHPDIRASCIFHVHDEIVLEVPTINVSGMRDLLEDEMCRTRDWAPGLPLSAEPVVMTRYGKG